MGRIKNLKKHWKILIVLVLLITAGFFTYQTWFNKTTVVTYQTTPVARGTLISTVSASGTINQSGLIIISTQTSGVVKKVYVKPGDKVSKGQLLAEVTPDLNARSNSQSAYNNYLSAQNSLNSANAKYNSLQATLFTANQTFINGAVAKGLTIYDPVYIEQNASWLQAESDYKNQQGIVGAAQAALDNASLTLQQNSTQILAPETGTLNSLALVDGLVLSSSTTSSGTQTSQNVGAVALDDSKLLASLSVSELDSVKVRIGQKVNLTLDALPNKSYTGVVANINKTGVVSSGVNTYPVIVIFDTIDPQIFSNMAVTGKIITLAKPDVLLVPSGAVSTVNGTTVRLLQNNKPVTTNVVIGDSSDTQTEIVSGVSENDQVITGQSSAQSTPTGTTNSVFGSTRGFGGGGGAVRIGR